MQEMDFAEFFSSELYRQKGHEIVDLLADHIALQQSGKSKVTRYRQPEDEYQYWDNYKFTSAEIFLRDLIEHTIHLHHPHYMGHQVSVPLPDQALIGMVSDLLNNGMGIYEMGQAPTAMERIVVEKMASHIGYSSKSGGFLTSGGTLANLTALLAARSKLATHKLDDLVILVSDQAHFCIERACKTMGIPPSATIKIESNKDFQIKTDRLPEFYDELTANGKKILAVVGCACSTSTGSYDDLEVLGQFCRARDLWFHVDGAHGGAAILSDRYKHLMKGVEMADSIVIDAHKMMLVPALATFVILKDDRYAYQALQNEAYYLFESREPQWFQLTKRTYETTKYMMSAKLYYLFKSYGTDVIADFIDRQYDLAKEFAYMIDKQSDFELATFPMSNIVCFRYLGTVTQDSLNDLNEAIRKKLLEDGNYYIVQTSLEGKTFLRITLMNPFTSIIHLQKLVETIRHSGNQ